MLHTKPIKNCPFRIFLFLEACDYFSHLIFFCRNLKSRKSDSIDESRFNVQEYVKEQTSRTTCPQCNLWVNSFEQRPRFTEQILIPKMLFGEAISMGAGYRIGGVFCVADTCDGRLIKVSNAYRHSFIL